MPVERPSYITLLESGELKRRSEEADKLLNACSVCPRNCYSDRKSGKLGVCLSGYHPVVSSYTPHFGEEPVLSGTRGAGNIFFGNCNLRCLFCQNYEISQNHRAENENEVSFERLSDIMLELQNSGCHNIGLVSPTHFSAQILRSVMIAAEKGLRLPIVYNTNGYDSVEMLKLYEGIADIYLPDIKYGSDLPGKQYSKVEGYFEKTRLALTEMFRQVGDRLIYDEDGIVVKGLIIRHLVLPNDISETEEVFRFIARELSPDVHISLMSQYYPANRADKELLISRSIRPSEYERALELMEKYGLKNGWVQEMESIGNYRPEFNKDRANPFGNQA